MRVHHEQPWHPVYLLQPLYGLVIAAGFEWGIAIYDMELDAVRRGEKSKARPARRSATSPARPSASCRRTTCCSRCWRGAAAGKRALAGNVAANVARNVWVHTIVFMGHLPEGAEYFTEDELERETRGGWYVRQLLGSCNLDGTRLFHILPGTLSFQIEHHLFPDLPSRRYPELAPRVRAVCERWGLPYSSGRLGRQWASVGRKILRLSLPGGAPSP